MTDITYLLFNEVCDQLYPQFVDLYTPALVPAKQVDPLTVRDGTCMLSVARDQVVPLSEDSHIPYSPVPAITFDPQIASAQISLSVRVGSPQDIPLFVDLLTPSVDPAYTLDPFIASDRTSPPPGGPIETHCALETSTYKEQITKSKIIFFILLTPFSSSTC
jgi:hypothetical protein